MTEVLSLNMSRIQASDILVKEAVKPKGYFLMSIHREENVDSPTNFGNLLESIDALTSKYGLPILISTHPRTRKKLDEISYSTTTPLSVFRNPIVP